jgi:hypothetical protein
MSALLTQQLPAAAGMAGAIAARTAIKRAYMARRGTEPPVDPGAEGSSWSQAIAWTAIMAAGAAVGRLLGRYWVAEKVDAQVPGQRELQAAE